MRRALLAIAVASAGCASPTPPPPAATAPPRDAAVVPAPRIVRESADESQVLIAWEAGEPGAGETAAPVTTWEVFRCMPGGEWKRIGETVMRELADATIDAGVAYEYRVRAVSDTASGRRESAFSASVRATTPAGYRLEYLGGSPAAALIKVGRRIGGDWKEQKYVVLPRGSVEGATGEIGRVEADPADENASLDFRTGCVLTSIEKARYSFKRTERRSRIVNGVVVTDDVQVDASRDRYRIHYLDETGQPRDLWLSDEK